MEGLGAGVGRRGWLMPYKHSWLFATLLEEYAKSIFVTL